jgi:hypothetical protein
MQTNWLTTGQGKASMRSTPSGQPKGAPIRTMGA